MSVDGSSFLCRLCQKSDTWFVDIFDASETDGVLVCDVIRELMLLEVDENDGLPTTACHECWKKLGEFQDFKTMCVKSAEDLKRNKLMLPEPCQPERCRVKEEMMEFKEEDEEDVDDPLAVEMPVEVSLGNSEAMEEGGGGKSLGDVDPLDPHPVTTEKSRNEIISDVVDISEEDAHKAAVNNEKGSGDAVPLEDLTTEKEEADPNLQTAEDMTGVLEEEDHSAAPIPFLKPVEVFVNCAVDCRVSARGVTDESDPLAGDAEVGNPSTLITMSDEGVVREESFMPTLSIPSSSGPLLCKVKQEVIELEIEPPTNREAESLEKPGSPIVGERKSKAPTASPVKLTLPPEYRQFRPLVERHFIERLAQKRIRRCSLCSIRGIRRETAYWCSECNAALCIDSCFEAYHTQVLDSTLPDEEVEPITATSAAVDGGPWPCGPAWPAGTPPPVPVAVSGSKDGPSKGLLASSLPEEETTPSIAPTTSADDGPYPLGPAWPAGTAPPVPLAEPTDGPSQEPQAGTAQGSPSKKEKDTDENGHPIFHKCDDCGKVCVSKYLLKIHKRLHDTEDQFLCKSCGKRFRTKGNLKIHIRTHTGEKPYGCPCCNMRFAQKGTMERHHRTHTGERPYVCPFCDRRFTKQDTMKNHIRIHTGERPYECNWCGKRYSARNQLVAHEKHHTGDKPFCCVACGRRFSRKDSYNYHLQTHLDKT